MLRKLRADNKQSLASTRKLTNHWHLQYCCFHTHLANSGILLSLAYMSRFHRITIKQHRRKKCSRKLHRITDSWNRWATEKTQKNASIGQHHHRMFNTLKTMQYIAISLILQNFFYHRSYAKKELYQQIKFNRGWFKLINYVFLRYNSNWWIHTQSTTVSNYLNSIFFPHSTKKLKNFFNTTGS